MLQRMWEHVAGLVEHLHVKILYSINEVLWGKDRAKGQIPASGINRAS